MSVAALIAVLTWSQAPSSAAPPSTAPAAPTVATGSTTPVTRSKNLPPVDDMAAWLVHLAKHQGHLVGRENPRAVTLQALALMQAATRVNPREAEAYLWQFDLHDRLERRDDALAALKTYVELTPDDETARLQYLATEFERLQTSEKRAAFLREQAARPGLPRSVASDLYRRLAEYHRQRRETEEAGKALESALRLMPTNVLARQLSYEVFGESEPALQRVELALALVAANPGQVNLLWELGEMLDGLSLHREAQEWYLRAIELHEATARAAVPAEYWAQLAQSYLNSTDHQDALDAVDKAIAADPRLGRARILRAHILERLKRPDAEAPLREVAQQYDAEAVDALATRNIARAAELAWFFAFHRPDKEKALKLAQLANSAPNATSLAQRSLGYAQLLDNKFADAAATLKPLIQVDQLAAAGYARALVGLNRESEAAPILNKAAHLAYSGVGYETIVDLLARRGEQAPTGPPRTAILDALKRFDRRVFDFYKRPGDFIRLSLRFADDPLPPVGPWRVIVRVENVGPVAVTLGEGMMAQPLVLISVQVGDLPAGRFDNVSSVMLNRRPVLLPGDVIETTTAVDVGAVREYAILTATETSPISVSALFDPVVGEQSYASGPTTVSGGPIQTTRNGIPRDNASVQALLVRLGDASVSQRIAAIDALGALLAVQDRTNRTAPPTAASLVQRRLAATLDSVDWPVRARALEAMRWSRQPPEVINRAARVLQDENVAVRLIAVRFFAEQQGERFNNVLIAMSQSDAEACVRMMAKSYLAPQ